MIELSRTIFFSSRRSDARPYISRETFFYFLLVLLPFPFLLFFFVLVRETKSRGLNERAMERETVPQEWLAY